MTDAPPSPEGEAAARQSSQDVGRLARAVDIGGGQFAWLLGAGASAMSGIPTAGALIARFKHELYCGAHHLDVQELDPAERHVRVRIEHYFDGANGLPPLGHPEEYSVAFERAYPDPAVRAEVIEQLCQDRRPNYGHWVLAALMAAGRLGVVFTTNFDKLVEQAAEAMFDIAGLTPRPTIMVAALGEPDRAVRALQRSSFPLVAKLHGDFQSVRLKNTTSELANQDHSMRLALRSACARFGFIVAGYSGRDQSVMDALATAAAEQESFPFGLYWCHRPGETLGPAVVDLLDAVAATGRTAMSVEVDNFVELAAAIERAVRFPDAIRTVLRERRPVPTLTETPLPEGPTLPAPILRLNALPLATLPEHARRLDAAQPVELADLQQAIRAARARGLVARRSGGELIAFGDDSQLADALGELGVTVTAATEELDFDAPHLDQAEVGILLDAVTIGLGRTSGLRHVLTRRAHQVRVSEENTPSLERLRTACGGSLCGAIPSTELRWAEALTLSLDRRNGRWWLLAEPDIWVSPPDRRNGAISSKQRDQQARAGAFVQARLATRYNKIANTILDEWARLVCSGRGTREVRAWNLHPGAGIDPTCRIDGHTAYSLPLAGPTPGTSP